MNEADRRSKQIIIAAISFLILGGISTGFYFGFIYSSPPPPTPTPISSLNLASIQVISTKLFNVQNNDYDFLAKIKNPNAEFGSSNVEYEIIFYNFAGKSASSKTGTFYILPGQTKYLVDTPIKLQEPASRAELKIKSADWQKLQPLAAEGVSLLAKNITYSTISQPRIFIKASGQIFNGSDFDLNRVNVAVVALDARQQPLAVNKTSILTFLARTTRGFEVNWFAPFVGQIYRIDVETNANVFENSNFLRTYGRQEKFKQLY